MAGQGAEKAGKSDESSGTATKQGASSAASSGSWGWGKGWLPTAALQQVAAGVLFSPLVAFSQPLKVAVERPYCGTEKYSVPWLCHVQS